MNYSIRPIQSSEYTAISSFIAEGYKNDVFFHWCIDNDADRARITAAYYHEYLKTEGCISHIATSEDGQIIGATCWLPDDVDASLYERINAVTEQYKDNFQMVADSSHANEPEQGPFYQLVGFVVRPDVRGCGIGAALLKTMLDDCDQKGIPTYLEASTPYHGDGVYGKFNYRPYGNLMHFTQEAVLYPLFRPAASC